ncbi:MAG TPA: hypothetical protein DCP53_09710 [Elusimicrobia bacterium]|nr:hypothetical protein [Elusimicrobiota bacterium]
MNKEVKDKAASVRARLTNIARTENIDFDALLLRYFQERFLYRLSISEFSNYFILKGGLLLISFDLPQTRPTKDIDFLGDKIINDIEKIKQIIIKIAELDYNDGVKFLKSSIESKRIKEDADYEGIRIKIDANLGQAKKKLQIDIGFGDKIVPQAETIKFPTLLDENSPIIKVYSVESIISEKFEAMIKLAMLNSRMKDFYDVYNLSKNHKFSAATLKEAIETTFQRRKTFLPDNPLIFQSEFQTDKTRQQQWFAFLNKSKLHDADQSFDKIMDRITSFLKPVVVAIKNNQESNKEWRLPGQWE